MNLRTYDNCDDGTNTRKSEALSWDMKQHYKNEIEVKKCDGMNGLGNILINRNTRSLRLVDWLIISVYKYVMVKVVNSQKKLEHIFLCW